MKQILGITADPKQKRSVVLDDGTQFTFTMEFSPMQQGWFIRSLTYRDFILQGLRICNQPNILYQFKNQLPFGIGCKTVGGREPSLQEDFQTQATKLYVLTAEEVDLYEDFLSGV